jgi:hypothetical protein
MHRLRFTTTSSPASIYPVILAVSSLTESRRLLALYWEHVFVAGEIPIRDIWHRQLEHLPPTASQ